MEAPAEEGGPSAAPEEEAAAPAGAADKVEVTAAVSAAPTAVAEEVQNESKAAEDEMEELRDPITGRWTLMVANVNKLWGTTEVEFHLQRTIPFWHEINCEILLMQVRTVILPPPTPRLSPAMAFIHASAPATRLNPFFSIFVHFLDHVV
jgi:hypothetical protein